MKRSIVLVLVAVLGIGAVETIPTTRNPRGFPDYTTPESYSQEHPEAGTRNAPPVLLARYQPLMLAQDQGLLALVAAQNLEAELADDLAGYARDLSLRGYTVEQTTYSTSGTPEGLKEYFVEKLSEGLVGAVLVGELPFAWYQAANDGDADGAFTGPPVDFTEEFPCDLYLADLDGQWADESTYVSFSSPLSAGPDGTYDSHSGDREPEIWVSRIDASQISYGAQSELYHSYFDKIMSYKQAELTFPSKGLFYVDDDWKDYFPDHKTDLVCDTLTEERDRETTCSDDYRTRLPQDGLYLTVLVHATPDTLFFKKPSIPYDWDFFYNWELTEIEPEYGFFNLFACSNCRWIEPDCMGPLYHFYGKGMAVVGSAKTGSMLDFGVFNTALASGESWGEAWITLTEYWMDYYPQYPNFDQYSRGWYMGLSLLGDGTLTVSEQTPVGVKENHVEPQPIVLKTRRLSPTSVEIRLELSQTQQVRLAGYDAAGRLVTVIHSGVLDAGIHQLYWDRSPFPRGVYFLSLETKAKRLTDKVTVF